MITELFKGLGPGERIELAVKDLFSRAQSVFPATAGGFTVPSGVGPVTAALYPFSALLRAGAQIVTLKLSTTLPGITASATAQWVPEGESPDDSALEFGASNIEPHRLAAVVPVTKKLLTQAPEVAEPAIMRNVLEAIAYAIQMGALAGAGGPEPLGLLFRADVLQPVTFAGAATLLDACAFEKAIADAFGEQGPLSFIASTATREKWRQIQKFSGSSTALWDDDDRIIGRQAFATPAIDSSDSRMVCGCFSLFRIYLFGNITITRDELTRAKEGIVEFVFNLFADAGPLNADGAFARSTDSAAQS